MKDVIKLFGIPVYSRSVQTGSLADPSQKLIDALGGSVTTSGASINAETALTISAVWRAINVVSGSLAFLPLHVYKKNNNGGRDHMNDHAVQALLDEPNKFTSDYLFRQTMQATKMLYGNAYAEIIRENGRPVQLSMIHPDFVTPIATSEGIVYNIQGRSQGILQRDMIHLAGLGFDGLKGKSVITIQRESLGLAKAAEIFGSRFFGSGANTSGVIEVPGTLTDNAYKNLKESWDTAYRGLGNSHGTPILEAGAQYKPISIKPEDAQFLQTRKFQIEEIARWFGVQPHMLMDLERSTNNNIEHQGMEFVTYTLAPEIALWESELKRKLFTNGERRTHYAEFNINALLRSDSKSRSEFYRGMFAVGAISPNEIRKLENMAAYDGGDRYYVQAGFVPDDKMDNLYNDKNTNNANPEN